MCATFNSQQLSRPDDEWRATAHYLAEAEAPIRLRVSQTQDCRRCPGHSRAPDNDGRPLPSKPGGRTNTNGAFNTGGELPSRSPPVVGGTSIRIALGLTGGRPPFPAAVMFLGPVSRCSGTINQIDESAIEFQGCRVRW